MSIRPLFAALAVLALAGCAADPAPNEQMRLTAQAVEQARAVGATADEVPEMKLAEDKYNRAKGSMADQSFRNARMRAEQAELDARLAEAKVELDRCESCHKPPGDSLHRPIKGNCAQCHSTQAWEPATFEHDKLFVLDRDHNAPCETCHKNPADYRQYTCYGCHEHTIANVRQEHEEEGIRNFDNCVKCHRSADEEPRGEGRGDEKGGERD